MVNYENELEDYVFKPKEISEASPPDASSSKDRIVEDQDENQEPRARVEKMVTHHSGLDSSRRRPKRRAHKTR